MDSQRSPNSSAAESLEPVELITERDDLLLAGIRAGDESACEHLYLLYHDVLWRFAYGYVRSAEMAEDIVQDIFVRLWERRASIVVRGSLRGWLYGAVRNSAFEVLRNERVAARVATEVERSGRAVAMGAAVSLPDAEVQAAELRAAVASALASLPERRRAVMTLHVEHGLSHAEIAQTTGASVEAVRMHISRARQTLSVLLGAFVGRRTPGIG
jgi:RNA polymerase sigma-70 factor (ECF subfamily)